MVDVVDDVRQFTISLLVEGEAIFAVEPTTNKTEAYEGETIQVSGAIQNTSSQADTLFVKMKLNDANGPVLDEMRQTVNAGEIVNFTLQTTMGSSDLLLYVEAGHEGR